MNCKKFIRLFVVFAIFSASAIMGLVSYYSIIVQDNYMVYSGQNVKFNLFGARLSEVENQIPASSNAKCDKNFNLSLFGIVPIKKIHIKELDKVKVIPCGAPFGVKFLADGVMVVDIKNVSGQNGEKSPAKEAGLKVGDVITSVNGKKVSSNNQLREIVSTGGGRAINLKYQRDFKEHKTQLKPEYSNKDEKWLAGLWVRDSSAGIGTLTFFTESGIFGGLGHPICDVDTGNIMPLGSGEIVGACINEVKPGSAGCPGEVCGTFSGDGPIGNVKINDDCGLFGKLTKPICSHEPVLIGLKQEAMIGKASIYSTLAGNIPKKYEIEIESIDFSHKTRNYVLKITDKELLKSAGGIVQGMSGSPIIQNGKLIGAVTHVFVNDPTRGYGVFAETMVEKSAKIPNQ